ncbi:MAG TPA: bifunctional UDP-N-acetylglucosamine diphosphorylase/glucosamine-1-phosphate N-acetyltransferase GlmU [Nitrospiraceae bacterium]|nr:bifunctional UDP-N-acetylglucosamine diphosphorylase/glucosamine-1-phosphate N-acetyltransferase GlmU [Nitrospiraceae bacterium]
MNNVGAIIMAAGLGKRMRSKLGKVLHPVAGRPMVLYAVELAERLTDEDIAVVIGHQGDRVKAVLDGYAACRQGSKSAHGSRPVAGREKGLTAHVKNPASKPSSILIAEQTQQLGTGHAVMQARSAILRARGRAAGTYLILNGDTPLLTEATVRRLLKVHEEEKAAVTILTAILNDPSGYGRVIRAHTAGEPRQVLKIVEDRDATVSESAVREINVGTYVVDGAFLFQALDRLQPQNVQQEYYLTDVVKLAVDRGRGVSAMVVADADEGLGVNSRRQLALAERVIRERIRARWMEAGVTLHDPASTWIDADTHIGQDTVLYPHVTLEGDTSIGQDCVIRSHTRVANSTVGDGVVIQDSCVIIDSRLEDRASVGPFAHLRPGSVLGRNAKVGNFVEMKKTELGEGAKASHLSYLGDARIGKDVNIGAGTITCNYDGYHKFETIIEDEVFIGSDTQLVAPVKVGRGSVIAAGTTITQDVPPNSLAISRTVQANRVGWASKRRAWLAGSETREAKRPEVKRVRGSKFEVEGGTAEGQGREAKRVRRSRSEDEPRTSNLEPRTTAQPRTPRQSPRPSIIKRPPKAGGK